MSQLLPEVPVTSLLSLFEVGVGVNLGVAFIDGARGMLLRFGKKIVDTSESVLLEFMPLLAQAHVAEIDEEAVDIAARYVKYSDSLQSAFAGAWLFFYFKFLSLLVAVIFVIAMLFAPYLTYQVSLEKAYFVGALTLFPLIVTFIHLMLAVLTSLLIWTVGQCILWRYKPLIQKAEGGLSSRPIL